MNVISSILGDRNALSLAVCALLCGVASVLSLVKSAREQNFPQPNNAGGWRVFALVFLLGMLACLAWLLLSAG
ncbi:MULTISPECIES: hypothetical protein [Brachybacterium]|uniref:Uncharacterized protein n=1 Tax=Brachybacterium kimchii TaxID=2942909 RepID=A0ABY4NB33_9MICO|nr:MULTISPECIES: hypothetical protein [Brachybacterium]MCG7308046.1 hypothetical protein [Brachybacterium sp. ACRRE]UQN30590.1 hypothetical protein M4486_04555 [Brachybacterium kimchii]